MKIKKLARALQAEIAADPELAKPSYCWCREQVVAPVLPGEPADGRGNCAFSDWEAFVQAVKRVARKAG